MKPVEMLEGYTYKQCIVLFQWTVGTDQTATLVYTMDTHSHPKSNF